MRCSINIEPDRDTIHWQLRGNRAGEISPLPAMLFTEYLTLAAVAAVKFAALISKTHIFQLRHNFHIGFYHVKAFIILSF